MDMYYAKNAIAVGTLTSFVMCVIFIYLLSYFAQIIAYLSIAATWIGLAVANYVFFTQYKTNSDQLVKA